MESITFSPELQADMEIINPEGLVIFHFGGSLICENRYVDAAYPPNVLYTSTRVERNHRISSSEDVLATRFKIQVATFVSPVLDPLLLAVNIWHYLGKDWLSENQADQQPTTAFGCASKDLVPRAFHANRETNSKTPKLARPSSSSSHQTFTNFT